MDPSARSLSPVAPYITVSPVAELPLSMRMLESELSLPAPKPLSTVVQPAGSTIALGKDELSLGIGIGRRLSKFCEYVPPEYDAVVGATMEIFSTIPVIVVEPSLKLSVMLSVS